jgi:preprotein translocase subunit YajC
MDPTNLLMIAVLAVLVFYFFWNSRKRKQQTEKLQSAMVPGVEIMTSFGLFGTLVSVDEVENSAVLEISPGTTVRVHRQTLSKVVTPTEEGTPRSVEEAMAIANREAEEREFELNTDTAIRSTEPEFGERTDESSAKPRRVPKNTDE